MDFSCWQAALPKYDVIAVLGRSAVLPGGALIELLGFLLQEKTLRLYLLQYDGEAWRQERDALPRPPRTPASNRRKLTRRAGDSYRPPLPHISRMALDDRVLSIASASSGRLSGDLFQGAPEDMLTVHEFLRAGCPISAPLQGADLPGVWLTCLEFQGEFDTIPPVGPDCQVSLTLGVEWVQYPAGKRLTLQVGKGRPRPLVCGSGPQAVRFYIHNVYLQDLYGDVETLLSDPRRYEGLPPEEAERAKRDIHAHVQQLCPPGMRLPVVEYETEHASLQFYSRAFLRQAPVSAASSVGFVLKPEHPTGSHGLPLRASLLESAVPPDTGSVDVELLHYQLPVPEQTISFLRI